MDPRGVIAAVAAALSLVAACTGSPAEGPRATPDSSGHDEATSGPPAPRPEPDRPVTLTVVGDLMLGRGVAAAHDDPTDTLRALAPVLRSADIAVGNLENTLSTAGPPTQGDDSFSAPPSVLRGLADAGFDALSLANNHTGDHGPRALVETVRSVRESPIRPFGAGRDLGQALRPAIVRRAGVRVGFLGFNAIGETPAATPQAPGALSVRMPPRTGPLRDADLRRVEAAVRRLDRRVDAVVVLPHWGTQYTHAPEPVQSLVGRRLVDAGADLVVGGHPHWVQPVERHHGVSIVHSLGNAVFDMDFMEQTMEGAVLRVVLRDGRFGPPRLRAYRMDATFTPRLLHGVDAVGILADMGAVPGAHPRSGR